MKYEIIPATFQRFRVRDPKNPHRGGYTRLRVVTICRHGDKGTNVVAQLYVPSGRPGCRQNTKCDWPEKRVTVSIVDEETLVARTPFPTLEEG